MLGLVLFPSTGGRSITTITVAQGKRMASAMSLVCGLEESSDSLLRSGLHGKGTFSILEDDDG